MRVFLSITLVLCFFIGLSQQNHNINKKKKQTSEVLSFDAITHNFGYIKRGTRVYHDFEVTNLADEDLVIHNIRTSCGCTTPQWDKSPIKKGEKRKIKIGYNGGGNGGFRKSITVYYNDNQSKALYITGHVWQGPSNSIPKNSAIQLLNKIK